MKFIKKYKILIIILVIILMGINFYILYLANQGNYQSNSTVINTEQKNNQKNVDSFQNENDNHQSTYKLLGIGTVVQLKGIEQPFIITARNVFRINPQTQEKEIYEYVGYFYPEGYMGDDYNIFFDQSGIDKVLKKPKENENYKIKLDGKPLDIGTVVILNGGKKEIIITGKNVIRLGYDTKYEYVGYLYPEGYISDDYNIFFNYDNIEKITRTLENVLEYEKE